MAQGRNNSDLITMKWILLGVVSLSLISMALSLTLGQRSKKLPIVETNLGKIRGLLADDGDYSMFMGIPYAKVDENNIFGAPIPYPNFETVFNAFDDMGMCPQREEFNKTIVGTLDCLHLNIYVPHSANSSNKLPVLTWIYGGQFNFGLSRRYLHGPKFLVQHDVILVTLNYRVGPYGFMCLDIPEVPGNRGLKDILLALKWINDNISAFNGDETKITLGGVSSGAMAIDLLILSNRERLYNQVILESGSALMPTVTKPSDRTLPIKLAAYLNFITDDIYEALIFLAKADTDSVVEAAVKLNIIFRACVEKKFNSESVITVHPEFITPKVKGMRILQGFNSYELLYPLITYNPDYFDGLKIFHDYLSLTFDIENSFEDMINLTKRFYIGDNNVSHSVLWDLINFASDFKFNHPIQRSTERYLENDAIVYNYLFSYSGERNFKKKLAKLDTAGAAHADELGYLFNIDLLKEKPNIEDQFMIKRMTTMWANFVKYGDPTPEINELLPIKWHPATKEKMNYINIDRELSAESRPYHDRLAFWDLFFLANYDKLIAHWDVFNVNNK